jgi:hypothetical protein
MSLLRSGSRLLPFPARRGGGALPPSSKPVQAGAVASGKPQRGWWLGVRATLAWRPFEKRPQAARGGLPLMPLAVRREGAGGSRGGRLFRPRMRAVRGIKVFAPSLGRIRLLMRALRPSACGPLGWRAHRVARLAHRLG